MISLSGQWNSKMQPFLCHFLGDRHLNEGLQQVSGGVDATSYSEWKKKNLFCNSSEVAPQGMRQLTGYLPLSDVFTSLTLSMKHYIVVRIYQTKKQQCYLPTIMASHREVFLRYGEVYSKSGMESGLIQNKHSYLVNTTLMLLGQLYKMLWLQKTF